MRSISGSYSAESFTCLVHTLSCKAWEARHIWVLSLSASRSCVGTGSVVSWMRRGIAPRRVDDMDVASMIMGASIASIAWIAFSPWVKLKRLKELEDAEKGITPR